MAAKRSSETVILQDTFSIFPTTTVSCKLILTEKILYIDYINKTKSEKEEVRLSDILGCHVLKNKSKSKSENKDDYAYLTIYAYPLKTIAGILSRQLRRDRRAMTFQMCLFSTLDENLKVVNKWQKVISYLIRGHSFVKNGG